MSGRSIAKVPERRIEIFLNRMRNAQSSVSNGLLYPARIRLTQDWIDIGGRRTPLAPGLAATAEIKTGNRRVIEYLLSPLSRRLQEAGRER
ncbi:hypothetical protein [Luteimonas suaedae]|uniref:hypothetical protein n=1 Tax=Luteimonas suaedae TaxID=2605430 RepID=UPI001658D133|nr:hypothetical protein [Luteimonas suaedae]